MSQTPTHEELVKHEYIPVENECAELRQRVLQMVDSKNKFRTNNNRNGRGRRRLLVPGKSSHSH